MGFYNQKVREIEFRLGFAIFINHLQFFLSVWLFSMGAIILTFRIFNLFHNSIWYYIFTGSGVLAAMLLAVFISAKQTPSKDKISALLDMKNNCGGLLMTSLVKDTGHWHDRTADIRIPKVSFNFSRKTFILFCSFIFFFTGLYFPEKYAAIAADRKFNVENEVQKLSEQLELLSEEEIIEEQTFKELEEKLEKMQQEAMGASPVKTWESLDHIEKSIKDEAEQATAESTEDMAELAKLEMLSEALLNGKSNMEDNLLNEAMAELATMIQKQLEEKSKLSKELSEQFKNSCKNGKLSDKELEKLLKTLKFCKGDMSATLQKLCKAGLIDIEKLKLCENAGKCNSEGLAKFLEENAKFSSVGQCLSAWCSGNCPGQGGVKRGRGDAPMMFGDESDEQGTAFKEQVLPRSVAADLEKSGVMGVSLGDPEIEDVPESVKVNVINQSNAGGGQASKTVVLPKHKAAVEKYFER